MRKAGFDALVFTGQAQKPLILVIEDRELELIDGGEFWGKTTEETERELKERFEGCKVASIGPAGNVEAAEKLFPQCMPEILEPTNETYKPDMVVYTEAYCAVSDALGVCKFSTTENFALGS